MRRPMEMFIVLNEIFTLFDKLVLEYRCEMIKTVFHFFYRRVLKKFKIKFSKQINTTYMMVSGLPNEKKYVLRPLLTFSLSPNAMTVITHKLRCACCVACLTHCVHTSVLLRMHARANLIILGCAQALRADRWWPALSEKRNMRMTVRIYHQNKENTQI